MTGSRAALYHAAMEPADRRTLVVVNGTLIDGSGRPPVANQAIVIDGARIRSVLQGGPHVAAVIKDGTLVDLARAVEDAPLALSV